MTIELGDCFERVWSDHDALSWDGTEEIYREATFLGHAEISLKNITTGDFIERAWFDEDEVFPVDPWPLLRMVA